MKFEGGGSLDSFLKLADETTSEVMGLKGPLVPALRDYHEFFTSTLWSTGPDMPPSAGLLAVNGHFYWLAAARVALSGQMTGVFPLLRTGLEAYCYAAMIKRQPELEPTWRERDKSDETRKACRTAFTPAVKDIAKAMEQTAEGAGEWIVEHYDAAIEWGGHPNAKIVFEHLAVEDRDSDFLVRAIALHGSTSRATQMAIIACLDLGLAMAAVAVWAFDLDDKLGTRLAEMQKQKEEAAAWRPS